MLSVKWEHLFSLVTAMQFLSGGGNRGGNGGNRGDNRVGNNVGNENVSIGGENALIAF